jgi:hypothetical protein
VNIRPVLAALGIDIDPEQIQKAFEDGKQLLPKIAADFEAVRIVQEEILRKITRVERLLVNTPDIFASPHGPTTTQEGPGYVSPINS